MPSMLHAALADYLEREIPGSTDNPKIARWIQLAGVDPAKDETSWCGAAMNHWCAQAGHPPPRYPALARSWLKWGRPTKEPQAGDVVVFWREDPAGWKGHVALYINRESTKIRCLGGNQGNAVTIAEYDVGRVLGYRTVQ